MKGVVKPQLTRLEIAAGIQADTLPLDPTCPACGGLHDVGEVFDGSSRWCAECDAHLVCVTYTDGTADMQRVRVPVPPLTGRQRSRVLWNRRGRR